MKNKDSLSPGNREHHPRISFGLFLIVLGLALLVATNDMLNLGSIKDYFTWETALVFIGVLLMLNLQFTGGLVLAALGVWFMLDNMDYELSETLRAVYWPSVVIIVGLGFIFSSFLKKKRK